MLVNFVKGFSYCLKGFDLIKQPPLLRFIWMPALCNIVLFLAMIFFAAHELKLFTHWIVHFLPSWLHWLDWLILPLGLLFSGIILLYVSTQVVNIIAGPFNSILSQKVIAYLKVPDNPNEVPLIQMVPATILRQTKFLLYYLPRAVFYLLLFIIPFVQVFAAFFWFLFNGWVFTMQYLDYPMDNHGISIDQMRKLMSEKRDVCLGFGSAVVLFTMIPIVNLVILPVAVIGATLLWLDFFPHPTLSHKWERE
jgi:CysZ protein